MLFSLAYLNALRSTSFLSNSWVILDKGGENANAYDNYFVEHTNEFFDHGVFFSQIHLQSISDIEELILHYQRQLSTSNEWEEILSTRNNRLFTSNWKAKDSENRTWLGTFLLTDIEENSQDYMLQFTAFQTDQPKIKKQGFFNRLLA